MDVVRLPVVCGPTAAGKSALALALAESCGGSGAIVSADSRQVYRRFDLGTAKPTPEERARVPHFGIDVADPTERYSAARWVAGAAAWIADARRSGRTPLVVGGTGFYLRALAAPLFEEPRLDPATRRALERELVALPTEELRRWAQALDPARAHLGRTQLLRAVEVALLTGERISDLHRRHPGKRRYTLRYLVVDPGPSLAGRIERRVDDMLAAGWLDEVATIMRDVPAEAPAWNAAGYEAIRAVVTGTLPLPLARERVIIETRQYAKRQRTWFRHQLGDADVMRVNPSTPDALERALEWWRSEGTT